MQENAPCAQHEAAGLVAAVNFTSRQASILARTYSPLPHPIYRRGIVARKMAVLVHSIGPPRRPLYPSRRPSRP